MHCRSFLSNSTTVEGEKGDGGTGSCRHNRWHPGTLFTRIVKRRVRFVFETELVLLECSFERERIDTCPFPALGVVNAQHRKFVNDLRFVWCFDVDTVITVVEMNDDAFLTEQLDNVSIGNHCLRKHNAPRRSFHVFTHHRTPL